MLGVVQPHPDLHHVPLPDKVEDVLHVLLVVLSCSPELISEQRTTAPLARCVTLTLPVPVCPGVAAQNWTALNTLTLLSGQTAQTLRGDTVRLTEVPGTSPCASLDFT